MRARSLFACSACGYHAAKWLGRCPECEAWGTLVEEPLERSAPVASAATAIAVPFGELRSADSARLSTGIGELDRVLGGGLVPGATVLIGGEPGIGKSTLLLQAAARLAATGRRALYLSGEESAAQLRLRGERLGITSDNLLVAAETDVDALIGAARRLEPSAVVVDSIQAVRCAEIGSLPGSVAQVRECAARFVAFAKASATPLLIVGHVTKDGTIAGPRTLEHLVDVVVQFEGDRHHAHRLLRTLKNRFGPADELGVFRMAECGLVEVTRPSELFLEERPLGVPGSVVLAAVEGSRPLLVEIQALVGEPTQGSPRRTVVGIDGNRVAMVLAVLQRRARIDLANRDVFVNVAGGVSIVEPAADLAVGAAIASAATGHAVDPGWVVFGEIGLTGEVRAVTRVEPRLREAARLGFTRAALPAGSGRPPAPGIEACPVADLEVALRRLGALQPARRTPTG